MTYADVIRANCNNKDICSIPWWPQFAFHFTDVTNATRILETGFIYSRTEAKDLGLMQNDNASKQVIDMTQTAAKSCARFYFRPLTPTQFNNEGFKHPALRYDGDLNANVPVPVFFLFDLVELLSMPGVSFSEYGQSGHGYQLVHGSAEFARLSFEKIYSDGPADPDSIRFRHAEINHPNAFPTAKSLRHILCRNEIEKATLLQLLYEKDYKTYVLYNGMIKVYNDHLFYNNGLFISDCRFYNNSISISFSDSYLRSKHIDYLARKNHIPDVLKVSMSVELEWKNNKKVLDKKTTEIQIDYEKPGTILLQRIPIVPSAKTLHVHIYFEGKLMTYRAFSIDNMELIK